MPADWKLFERQPLTQDLGRSWVISDRNAVLEIPSAIIDGEINYLINSQHPDFEKIKLVSGAPFVFDPRIKSNEI